MKNYCIENLLVGSVYRPKSYARKHLVGVIDYATKRDNVWAGSNATAYSVRWSDSFSGKRYWSTITVSHPE